MAEGKRYVGYDEAKYLWDKAAERYVRKDGDKVLSDNNYTTEEKTKLEGLENYELPVASADTLGGMKIGAGLHVDENGVVNTVYNPEMPVEWDDIENPPTTLEGYGITDAATKEELEDVKEELGKVYHPKGSVPTYADLLAIENPSEGDVYDVLEDDKNYAWVKKNDEWVWDDIGGQCKIDTLTQHDLDIITGSTSDPEIFKELIAEGGEIELDSNMSFSEPLTVTKDTVLDLCGNAINSTVNGYLFTAGDAKLTIKGGRITASKRIAQALDGGEVVIDNGTFVSGDVAVTASGEGSKITFNGGSLSAQEGGIGAFDKGSIEINGGTITGLDNFPVFTNGTSGRGGNTIVMNGGELVGNIQSEGYESCGVYIANNDSFTMNGGTITSNGGCGILMRAGNVIINNGTVTATTGEHVPGWVGDSKNKMSASAVIYHESANYPGKAGMSLTINGGTFTGADHALEILSNEATPNVTVNGGTFVPDFPE